MIEPRHLLEHVIRPVLKDIGYWSEAAERLVLGTACQESQCGRWLVQLENGPARGIFQIEPATEKDCWDNFIQHRQELRQRVTYWRGRWGNGMGADEMVWNLAYATAMCRIHYLRVPDPIPDNLPAQAAFWKKFYNTEKGKGTVEEYLNNWNRFVGGLFA